MKTTNLILLIVFSTQSFSQGINNLWLTGYANSAGLPWGGTKLDFITGSLSTSVENRPIYFAATNGVISDQSGNLLFCSNGVYVANALYDTMANGSDLNPCYYTSQSDSLGLNIPQANLIIPFPGDSNKYYLFHESSDDYGITYCTLNLYYCVVDMNLDGGLGMVTLKNNILFQDSLVGGRLTACKHANGRDWWLVTHQFNSDVYQKFLITPYGILGPYSQVIGVVRDIALGQVVFSPNGKKFAYYAPSGDLDIMDFDRCSGDFSNLVHVDFNDSAFGGGVAFSPNSNVLYVSSMNYIYQFDMTAPNVIASQITVAVYDGFYSLFPPQQTTFHLSQLMADGKIYIISGNSTTDFHVINSPDSLGIDCDVCQHCINVSGFNAATIPNYPNYFLGAEGGTICDSLPTSTQSLTIDKKGGLKIIPNPVVGLESDFVYDVLTQPATISIFNVNGKRLAIYDLPQWSSIQHVRLPKLVSGVYMARLESKEHFSNVKFIVE